MMTKQQADGTDALARYFHYKYSSGLLEYFHCTPITTLYDPPTQIGMKCLIYALKESYVRLVHPEFVRIGQEYDLTVCADVLRCDNTVVEWGMCISALEHIPPDELLSICIKTGTSLVANFQTKMGGWHVAGIRGD
jgi:hypothetical protein